MPQGNFDHSIAAAAHAQFQLVQQLQQQVATFKDEAGKSEDTNRTLTTTINDLLQRAETQTNHVKGLEWEMDQLRGSRDAFRQDWQQQLDRANRLSHDYAQAATDRDRFFKDANEWRRQFDSVNSKGSKSKDRILDLSNQVGDLRISLFQARREADKVEGLNSQITKHKQQEQAFTVDLQQKLEQVRQLESDLGQCRARVDTLETQLNEHKREIEKMDKQLDRSTPPVVATPADLVPTASIELPQLALPVADEDSRWMPEADFDISRKLDTLWQDLTSWSKTYARKQALDLRAVPLTELQHLQRRLQSIMAPSENGAIDLSTIHTMGAKGPSIVLLAVLANALYGTFLNNPFHFINADASGVSARTTIDGVDLPDTTVAGFFACLQQGKANVAQDESSLLILLRGSRRSQ